MLFSFNIEWLFPNFSNKYVNSLSECMGTIVFFTISWFKIFSNHLHMTITFPLKLNIFK